MEEGYYMRRGEVVAMLGISINTLLAMVESGVLERVQLVPNGQYYFVRDQVEALKMKMK